MKKISEETRITQNEYRNEFNKKTYARVLIRFKKNDEIEQKIFKHIKKQDNINRYFINLVKADMGIDK